MGKTSHSTSGLTDAVQALRDAIGAEQVMSEADARSAGYVSILEFAGDMSYEKARRLLQNALALRQVESASVSYNGRRCVFYRTAKR